MANTKIQWEFHPEIIFSISAFFLEIEFASTSSEYQLLQTYALHDPETLKSFCAGKFLHCQTN